MKPGRIDPTLKPDTAGQRAVFKAVIERGLTLRRRHPGCPAVELTGPGLHVIAADINLIRLADQDAYTQ